MRTKSRRLLLALLIAALPATPILSSPQTPAAGQPTAAKPGPWDTAVLKQRRQEAENRQIFATDDVLAFTLTADFKAVNRDRNPNSTKLFPATLTIGKTDGTTATFPLQIRTRGHARRLARTCTFAPLRLEFQADQVKGTIFEGHKALKLGTHCRGVDRFEQYVPLEYSAYRIFNLLTPRSFRARLAKATYVDVTSGKPIETRNAMFIEDDDDVARRMEGRISDLQKMTFRQVNLETLSLLTLFEYLIGNTDMSMYVQHNIRLVEVQSGALYPIPYDFDYAGLVNAVYAIPAAEHKLSSVRERLYLGPCRTAADLEPLFERMRTARPDILALFDRIPGVEPDERGRAVKYIEQFYETIGKPNDVKRAFVDNCNGRAGI